MFYDPGFLSLVIIFAIWIVIIFLGLLVGFMPRSWRQKPSGKIRGERKWHWPTISRKHNRPH